MPWKKSWSTTDEELLIKILKEQHQIGNSQKEAFQEYEKISGFTASAASQRFHNILKKQYEAELPKFKRKKKVSSNKSDFTLCEDNIDDAIELDTNQLCLLVKHQASVLWRLRKENNKLQKQLDKLTEELKTLTEEIDHLQKIANPNDPESIQVTAVLRVFRHAKSIGLLDKSVLAN